jgi:Abortive infection alpha
VLALILLLLKMACDLPGVRFLERELAGIERVVMRQLRHRLDVVVAQSGSSAGAASAADTFMNGSHPVAAESATLAETMERLLRRSMDQTRSESRASLFARMLEGLVPDEARIVSALSDGSIYPLIEIAITGRGAEPRTVLKNASSVGRAAGVADPSLVPTYVTHLMLLGLAETGPEDSRLDDDYQILLTDGMVRSAHQEATAAGRRAARVSRATVRISSLGREFWSACQSGLGVS